MKTLKKLIRALFAKFASARQEECCGSGSATASCCGSASESESTNCCG